MPSLLTVALFVTVVAALGVYAVFVRPPSRISRRRAQAGVVTLVALVLPALWYGAYQEWRAPHELAEFIVPYPARTGATWVPPLSAARDPIVRGLCLAQRADTLLPHRWYQTDAPPNTCAMRDSTRVWILATADSPAVVIRFYRDRAARDGWTVKEGDEKALMLVRAATRLFIFASSGWRETTIVYSVEQGKN